MRREIKNSYLVPDTMFCSLRPTALAPFFALEANDESYQVSDGPLIDDRH